MEQKPNLMYGSNVRDDRSQTKSFPVYEPPPTMGYYKYTLNRRRNSYLSGTLKTL